MEYQYCGHEKYPRPVVEALVAAIVRKAELQVKMSLHEPVTLAAAVSNHCPGVPDTDAFKPVSYSDMLYEIRRDGKAKRFLYYCPAYRAFLRGTYFGRESSLRLMREAVDAIGVARELLVPGDFGLIVEGKEPAALAAYEKVAASVLGGTK